MKQTEKSKIWLQGYGTAVKNFKEFINANSRLFAPSTLKTFMNRFTLKFNEDKLI